MDNTWIIYTSDHGEMLGDHRCSHKGVFYESSLNIPLIIRPPKGMKGWQSKALTDQLDVVESMMEIAEAPCLEGEFRSSLVSKVLDGPDAPEAQIGKDAVFSEVYLFSMVRDDKFKMTINTVSREPLEFYDMEQDPKELRNLVEDPSYEQIRSKLMDEYLSGLLDKLDQAKVKVYQDTLAADPHLGGWKS